MTQAAFGDIVFQNVPGKIEARQFYNVVKKRTNFLVVIETNENYVFGAYTSTGFGEERENGVVNDLHSFVFSMRRDGITECHCFRPINPARALSFDKYFGVSFGENELVIQNDFTVTHAFLGDSYHKPEGYSQLEKRNFLAGSTWHVSKIEIFQVQRDLVSYDVVFARNRNIENYRHWKEYFRP